MSAAAQPLTPLDSNKALVIRWFDEVWNQGRLETIHELFAPNAVLHDGPTDYHGPEEFLGFYNALRVQFSDFRVTPILTLAEEDRACIHWSAEFTHIASKKRLQIMGTSIVRIENNRFVEAWQNWDAAHLHTQLTGESLRTW